MPPCARSFEYCRLPPEWRRAARAGLAGSLLSLLLACGGGGGSGTTPPAGGGATAETFYLAGPSGIRGNTTGTINFAVSPSSGTDLALTAVAPATGTGSALAQYGTWAVPAQIGQWTPASGSATAIGARYQVYAASDSRFHLSDLQIVAGAAAPVTTTLSTLATSAVCSSAPSVINDLASPAHSLLVFDTPGPSQSCGGTDDVFTVVPVSASASTAPGTASPIEPVDAVRDATGAIKQLLLLVHDASAPSVAVSTGTSLGNPVTIGPLHGLGLNAGGSRDFQSLAVISVGSSTVWLYRDLGDIYGVNLSSPSNPVLAFQGEDADAVQGPAIIDGTVAYLAMVDQTHCTPSQSNSCTNQIVRIDAATLAAGSGQKLIQELTTGLQLLGITGSQLIYEFTDGSALKTIAKSPATYPATSTPIFTGTGTASINLSGLGTGFTPLPVVVSGGVYYTVYTPSAAAFLQAWFFDGTTSSPKGSFSQVLGGVVASTVPTANAGIFANPASNPNAVNPPYGGALIANIRAGNTRPDVYPGATFVSYDNKGSATATLGSLPRPISDDYDVVAIAPGILQAGSPALLEVSGYSQSPGATGNDLFQITPGTANSLIQVTKNLQ